MQTCNLTAGFCYKILMRQHSQQIQLTGKELRDAGTTPNIDSQSIDMNAFYIGRIRPT